MIKKTKVGILCGGQSEEHQISLLSAKNIIEAIDKKRFEISVFGIDRSGGWTALKSENFLLHPDQPDQIHFITQTNEKSHCTVFSEKQKAHSLNQALPLLADIDVVIPALHGPNGEDGSIQGFLKTLGLPYVGCEVLGSAMCMDKDITKKILLNASLPVCKYLLARKNSSVPSYQEAQNLLGPTLFIKPCNMGSSVGVSKASNETDYKKALDLAFKHDRKVIIEEAIEGRELEIAILGNSNPKATVVGEVIPTNEFYSYEAKYLDSEGAQLAIPAEVPSEIAAQMSDMAIKAFLELECQGLARCDFFLTKSNELLINEVNTFPGFTKISQYPKLWEASGVSYQNLISELIELAIKKTT